MVVHAEERARRWWQQHQDRFGSQPPYLAVQTNLLLQGEIVQDLYAKLIHSETTASFFGRSTESYPQEEFYGVVIFDTRTGHVVSPQGYAIADTPLKGQVTRFGPYLARYIGTGK